MGQDRKVYTCGEYAHLTEKMKCGRVGFEYECYDLDIRKTETACSEPKDSFEEAKKSLEQKFSELSKTLRNFQAPQSITDKFCETVHWLRTGSAFDAILPLIHREKEEICEEGETLEVAQKGWGESAVAFVKSHPSFQFQDARFQRVAEKQAPKDVPVSSRCVRIEVGGATGMVCPHGLGHMMKQ